MTNTSRTNLYYADGTSFIWGVKSKDDLSKGTPNLDTMNDIEITYDEKKKIYCLEIEDIYKFDSNKSKGQYLSWLIIFFQKYLISIGVDMPKLFKRILPDNENANLIKDCMNDNFNCKADNLLDLYIEFEFKVSYWIENNKGESND